MFDFYCRGFVVERIMFFGAGTFFGAFKKLISFAGTHIIEE